MLFLGSKYAKIAFAVGDHAGGAYSAPPGSLAGLRGPTSTGRGEEDGTNNILGITLTNTNI